MNKDSNKRKLNYVSLFSSAGVGCYGFKLEDFDCVLTNENISRRLDVQKYNNKCKYDTGYISGSAEDEKNQNEILNEIENFKKREKVKEIDVILSTPPCQGMSVANHKKKNEIERNSLVVYSIKLVREVKPRIFIFENVKAFLNTFCTDFNGEDKKIKTVIENRLGGEYNILFKVINFKDYGSNSSRTRTLVIGTRKDIDELNPYDIFPKQKKAKKLMELIGYLPELKEMGEIYNNDIYHSFRRYKPHMLDWIKDTKEGQSAFDNTDPLKRPYQVINGVKKPNVNKNGDKYSRCFWNKIAPCVHTRNDILASQATIHPRDNRVFSIRELMLMMAIPDSFKWSNIDEGELNRLTENEKKEYLKKSEMNIRQCLGEAVPTVIFNDVAKNINEFFKYTPKPIKEIETIITEKELYNVNNLISFIEKGKSIKLYEIFKITELANAKRLKHSAYYTRQDVCFSLINELPDFKNIKEINILEPSVGAGNFVPLIIKKYEHLDKVNIDLLDIDSDILKLTKKIIHKINVPDNINIKFINDDFILKKFDKRYDIVIGNPPFGKLTKNKELLALYKDGKYNNKTNNTASFFIEKSLKLGDTVALITPKSLLSVPEFILTRELLSGFNINNIIDYGEKGFKGVKIETISFVLNKKNNKDNKVKISSYITKDVRFLEQSYLMNKSFPAWLIYRDEFFDKIYKKLKLDIFKVFRDRIISKKHTKNKGKYRVLKSRNISNNKIINIDDYDCYIDDLSISPVGKFINKARVILFPNLTYNPRACFLPKNSIVDGSVALLVPKNGDKIEKQDVDYYSTDEFKKYYMITRNLGTRSLNIDSSSVFFIGILRA